MGRPTALGAEAVAAALSGLPAWTGGPESITRSVTLDSMSAIAAVAVRIAALADERDHHPDLDLRYRTIRVLLSTHSAGGVTELDLALAREIDTVLDGPPNP